MRLSLSCIISAFEKYDASIAPVLPPLPSSTSGCREPNIYRAFMRDDTIAFHYAADIADDIWGYRLSLPIDITPRASSPLHTTSGYAYECRRAPWLTIYSLWREHNKQLSQAAIGWARHRDRVSEWYFHTYGHVKIDYIHFSQIPCLTWFWLPVVPRRASLAWGFMLPRSRL